MRSLGCFGLLVLIAIGVAGFGLGLGRVDEASHSNPVDQSTDAVSSCDFNDMMKATEGIPTISAPDASKICRAMTASIGNTPPMNVLRSMFKITSLLHLNTDAKEPYQEIAYQLTNIVEARGITDPSRMIATYEVVYKITVASNGHVTPRDLNIMLRSAGPSAARKLSDEGLVSMAALIWEEKKAHDR